MMTQHKKPRAEEIHHWFVRATLISAIAVSVVLFLGSFGVAQLLAPFGQNAKRMEDVSQQSIRLQNLTIQGEKLARAKRPGQIYALRAEIAADLNAIVASHRSLAYVGDKQQVERSLSGNAQMIIFDPETGLDRYMREFADDVRTNLLGEDLTVPSGALKIIEDKIDRQLNPQLSRLVRQFSAEAQSGLRGVLAAQLTLIAVAIAAMLVLAKLTFQSVEDKVIEAIHPSSDLITGSLGAHDGVTGLPNRTYLRNFMKELCDVTRDHDLKSAVVDLKIGDFEGLQTTLTGQQQHEFAAMAARRIESVTRGGDFIARIAEDEFLIVITALANPNALNDIVSALRTKLAMPFHLTKAKTEISTKIGITFLQRGDRVPDTILNQAAVALDVAMASPDHDIQFYSNGMLNRSSRAEEEFEDLSYAIKDDQLKPHYQPIINSKTGQLIGMEALVRWHHPDRGELAPIHFIETAETRGLSNDITRVVLGGALRDLQEWHSHQFDVPTISINLSVEQLTDRKFAEELKWIVDSYDQHPSRVAIEVTEKSFRQADASDVLGNLASLQGHGFQIYFDNFGSGYVDLKKMTEIKVDLVKLDRAFVANIDSDSKQQVSAVKTIKQAHARKLMIAAEGVETPAERLVLQRLGIDAIQGYLISVPLSSEAAVRWLEQNSTQGADYKNVG